MPITLDTGLTNFKATPGIISDIFANRPVTAETGTLFISIDTGAIYSYNAGWVNVTVGGGGPTPGIDSVLAVAQAFTANRTINANTRAFTISGVTTFTQTGQNFVFTGTSSIIANSPSISLRSSNNQFLNISGTSSAWGDIGGATAGQLQLINDYTNAVLYTKQFGITYGLYVDIGANSFLFGAQTQQHYKFDGPTCDFFITGFSPGSFLGINLRPSTNTFQFGQISQGFNNPYFEVFDSAGGAYLRSILGTHEIGIKAQAQDVYLGFNYLNSVLHLNENFYKFKYTNNDTLLIGDFTINNYKFGDWSGINASSSAYLEINNNNSTGTYNAILNYQGNPQGLVIDFAGELYTFGDATASKTSVEINAGGNVMTLRNTDPIDLNDNGSGNMLSTTAGGSAGQHLIIKVNGNTYKIALLNP